MQESKRSHYIQLHLIVFIWGFTAILGKLISIDAIPLVWCRMTIASICIAAYFIWKKKSFQLEKKTLVQFFFTGIIIAIHWITFFHAIKISNVSVALVTMSTGAFFTALIEPLFFKKRINVFELFLGVLVILGLYIIFNFESKYAMGIIFALISSSLSSLFAVLNGLFVKKYQPNVISFYQLSFGALAVGIYLLATGTFASVFSITSADILYLFILGSFCTAWAFIISVKVMKALTPYTVMLTINLEPIYAIILALLIFGESEKMNSQFYFGAALVLFVVLLNGVLKQKKRQNT